VRHFAINAAHFSISTIVLQKQHSFKHKRRFSQVHEHKNQVKTILHKFYRAMHYSAKRGLAIVCRLSVRVSVRLFVCDVGGS